MNIELNASIGVLLLITWSLLIDRNDSAADFPNDFRDLQLLRKFTSLEHIEMRIVKKGKRAKRVKI